MAAWKELMLKDEKYTDAEAVAAVATADNYVKLVGDTMSGTLVNTYSAGSGFDIRGWRNFFRMASGNVWAGFSIRTYGGVTRAWFGGTEINTDEGAINYIMYKDGANDKTPLIIDYRNVHIQLPLLYTNLKSGSTQANAGAAATEVWKTSGHATLPDNVLMIGV